MRAVCSPATHVLRTQLRRTRIGQPLLWNRASAMEFSVVPFKLADIGEGIAEVELLKWFVKVHSVQVYLCVCSFFLVDD
jgi:hypothetical protein